MRRVSHEDDRHDPQITPSGGLTNRVIGNGGPWRVLIVDDEETIRLALSKFLRSRGYNVQTAESGPAALDLLQRGKYVLMLCDVRMPGLDWRRAVPRALSVDPELAIVYADRRQRRTNGGRSPLRRRDGLFDEAHRARGSPTSDRARSAPARALPSNNGTWSGSFAKKSH